MIAQALQVTLTLLLVLAVIGAVAWLAQAARKAQPRRDQALQVRASVALGARERVVVLEVGGQWLLLGVASGRINTLAQLPGSPFAAGDEGAPQGKAGSWLATWLGKSDALR